MLDTEGGQHNSGAIPGPLSSRLVCTFPRYAAVAWLVAVKPGVFDIWESQQDFDKFGATLMPILQEIRLDPGQPMVEQVHNHIPA